MTTPKFEVFYDGDCPLCLREIRMLRRLDKKSLISFTDIAAPEFDANIVGVPLSTLMASIHGRVENGPLITGVEVFRQLYSRVGFRPLVTLSRLPLVSQSLDAAYRIFARNRLRITGRHCDDERCGELHEAT